MAIYSQLSVAKKLYNGYLQSTVNSDFYVFALFTSEFFISSLTDVAFWMLDILLAQLSRRLIGELIV